MPPNSRVPRHPTGVSRVSGPGAPLPRRAMLALLGGGAAILSGCGPARVRAPRVDGRIERGTLLPGQPVVHRLQGVPGRSVVVRVIDGGQRFDYVVRDPIGQLVFDSAGAPGRTERFAGSVTIEGTHTVELIPTSDRDTRYAVEIGLS